jgi:3-hydroxybutyryl-CoA dehydrogenase
MPKNKTSTSQIEPVGLIGLGLMGRGIATCLLSHGLRVIGHDSAEAQSEHSLAHIDESLKELVRRRALPRSQYQNWRRNYSLATSIEQLSDCRFVIESVTEDLAVKRGIFSQLEIVLRPRAVIASNTSSYPITVLQAQTKHPERFVGMHWGEPAQVMRYLEITPGAKTSARTVRLTRELGKLCGKDPAVLQQDIRGFLSNRMMYAMMREACYLVEAGIADIETVDRSFRNDMGWWATLFGPFRWMDLTGLPDYAVVMQDLFPELSNAASVPKVMQDIVASGAEGTPNGRGFYKYTKAEASNWEKAWVDLSYDIKALVEKYEKRVKL